MVFWKKLFSAHNCIGLDITVLQKSCDNFYNAPFLKQTSLWLIGQLRSNVPNTPVWTHFQRLHHPSPNIRRCFESQNGWNFSKRIAFVDSFGFITMKLSISVVIAQPFPLTTIKRSQNNRLGWNFNWGSQVKRADCSFYKRFKLALKCNILDGTPGCVHCRLLLNNRLSVAKPMKYG